jgi:tetratricopeptide (TPR) repeat protein
LIAFFPTGDATAAAHVALSQTLEAQGERDAALAVAMQASARYPDRSDVLQNTGEFLGLTGNAFGAANAFLAAEDAGAGNPELLLAAARYFRAAGLPQEARHTYGRLRDTYPRTAQALQGNVEAAELAYANGEASTALAQLEDIVATTKGRPERLQAVRALMRVAGDLGLRDRVVALAEESAALSEEPEVLAEAALALLEANALAPGQEVFDRVDLARVRHQTAHQLLMRLGEALLQVDPARGLARMEEAYLAYPNARTPEGDVKLLDVYLATGRGAAARRIVTELADHVRRSPVDTPLLIDAATAWGDWLYARNDHRAAADAFAMAVEAAEGLGRPLEGLRSDPRWAKFQQANALFAMANYSESLPLYQQIAGSDAPWAPEAQVRATQAELEQRLRGTVPRGISS